MRTKRDLSRLTQQEAAELAGVTARALRDWQGVPRNGDGSYPGPEFVAWLVARAAGDSEHADQRQRLAAAQAERAEMDNAARRGQLVDVEVLRRSTAFSVRRARDLLLGLPDRVAPAVVGIGDVDEIRRAVNNEVRRVCEQVARIGAEYSPDVDVDRA